MDNNIWTVIPGIYKIQFRGDSDYTTIVLKTDVLTTDGRRLYLITEDEEVVNWDNVLRLKLTNPKKG